MQFDNQIISDGQPDEVLSQNRSEIPPRMLYVTVNVMFNDVVLLKHLNILSHH